jgi:hypothetical protein
MPDQQINVMARGQMKDTTPARSPNAPPERRSLSVNGFIGPH